MNTVTQFDFRILDFIQNHIKCGFLDFLMPKVTFLGNKGIVWIVTALILLLFSRHRKKGVMMAAGLVSGLIVCNFLLKNIVARDRPCWINEQIPMLIKIPGDYSFPSGHTMSSFVSSSVLFHCSRKAGAAAFLLSFMIAFSRLYLYVHFPTDVLAGALIGIVLGVIICIVTDRFFNTRTEKEFN